MKIERQTTFRWFMMALGILFPTASVWSQTPLGNGFTYQGQLNMNGSPANGSYDLQFSLWNAAVAGTQVGTTLCSDNVTVT
ncbi:MAG TPA: hypothetical protein VGM03_22195, partial [Phycisphaerae bacterium]